MNLRTFQGTDLPATLDAVRAALGEDAMIIHTTQRAVDGRNVVEVVAAPAERVAPLTSRLQRDAPRGETPHRSAERPRVVALVGPTGAGKTTTAAKLALHADAFGGRRVGFLALDTYRVGALEQLQTYADIMGAPVEVAYHSGEIDPAMDALSDCDVVIVDAPGRSPSRNDFVQWRVALKRTRPDEVHLVLPAVIRPSVAVAHWAGYTGTGVTHLIITKLDEMPDAGEAYDLVEAIDLPVRWVTDGQDVPGNLRRGGAALFTAAAEAAHVARARLAG